MSAGPRAGCALLLGALACSTTHQPRVSPRIAFVIRTGEAEYVKDGRRYPIGPLGGDLPGLVAGNVEAERLAGRARHQLAVGVPAYLTGAAAVIIGLLVHKPAGWVAVGSGAAVGAGGIVLMGAGFTNTVDAINVYNDGVR